MAVALLLAYLAPEPGLLEPQAAVFPVSTETVRVDVAVSRAGVPVQGLGATNFEVSVDGRTQKIDAVVEARCAPADVAILLDLSAGVTGPKLAELKSASNMLLDSLQNGDRASLYGFSHQVALLAPPTTDLPHIRGVLAEVRNGGSTALRDALLASTLTMESSQHPAIVLFSDGADNISWVSVDTLERAVRAFQGTIYAVLTATAEPRAVQTRLLLERMTRATGGRLFDVDRRTSLTEAFASIIGDRRHRYIITFGPPNDRSGWHSLKIRAKSNGESAHVLARPGYWRSRR